MRVREKKEEISSVVKRWETNWRAVANTVSRTIAYNPAKSSSVVVGRMQSAVKGNPGPCFPLTDIISDKLLWALLQTVANTCIREPILIVLDALDECGGLDEHSQSCKLMRDKLSTLPTIF